MTPHMLLCYLTTLFHLIFITLAQTDNYIIFMNISVMPKPFLTQHTWYISTLSSALENPQLISSKLIYTYTHVINGFSVNLSPKEHQALTNSPGYISSVKDLQMKLDTTYSPQFLGLNPKVGAWPDSEFGKGIVIGLVDTGIWPESKSFRDNKMSNIPSKWKGHCEDSIHFNSSLCNKKLIGAKFFNRGLLAQDPNATLGLNSTRDTVGHGTHTSSTAAGSRVDNASFFGYAAGTASGVAPNSHVAMYKVVWKDELVSSDVIAAIDAAISDDVDILSLSFGSTEFVPLYEDPLAIATFAAMKKGVFVSCAAGNGGPDLETLHNGMPWVITSAAGTMDRDFQGILTLGNGNKVMGFSVYVGTFSSHNVPIVFMGLCDNVNELKKVKRMIVVCEDKNGTSLSYQPGNLGEVNVYGAVLISNTADTYYSSDDYTIGFQNSLAAIFVDPIHGEIIKAYIKSYYNSNHSSIASMSFRKTGFGLKTAPSVDSYSSRGPSYSCPFVLKPDITAPGTSILAAWPSNVTVAQKYFRDFNLDSGTSMACPHVAGVAALVKGTHRNWSPAAIRSAIMTTSDILDNNQEHIKDIGTGSRATPFALGAGHVNPKRALNPGLVYDVGVQDYVNLLCALNITQKNITAITRSSSNDCSKPSLDLNYPSFIAFFNGENSSSKTIQEFYRTVTNVGEGQATYVASITPIEGFRATVIPNNLVFNEKNEKLSYKLRIEVAATTKLKELDFGYLTWMDTKQHVVRSPIVVTTLKLKS
ncbi:subtilisin-like protease SBT1.9 [Trifolium pratense]|uniref:subtilisin-like protease SBT1.9 n=1 Tax=Trifolium pratense TaxID=57577 RepID=UPI001E692014|nr:subtilisin-like protease SBT1.9 [Trifolium pratense]